MPRKSNQSLENNFTKGLVSYATGMNFPENAVTDTNNFIFNPWGLVERRLGFDFLSGEVPLTIGAIQKAVSSFLWKDVAGDGTINFLVLQTGLFLNFYQVLEANTVPQLQFQFDMTPYITSSLQANMEFQYAAGNGFLFVVGALMSPVAFQYVPFGGFFNPIPITIMIRDFDGSPEPGIAVNQRPGSLSNPHWYNLLNQGWSIAGTGDNPGSTAVTFNTQLNQWPSNSDIWFQFKDSTNTFNPAVTNTNVIPGNTLAPRGHFVLDAFVQDRTNASAVAVPTTTANNNRPSVVAFFAGRVWYAGVQWSGFAQNVYFSQIISTVGAGVPEFNINNISFNQFGACFQSNDPTAETTFDLLPDDGGVVRIPDMGTVFKLFPIQNALIIFASNGIWFISGSQGTGFEATNFNVSKLSSIRCISPTSFIDVLGYPMWWTHEGVYALTVDTTANISSGGLKVNWISTPITQFFQNIPGLSKTFARGTYDPINYTVNWLYNSQNPVDINTDFTYDSVLILNTLTNAWYKWKIPIDKVQLRSSFLYPSVNPAVDSYRIIYIASTPFGDGINSTFHFATPSNANFLDWFSFNSVGEPYDSTLTTGFKLHGQADKRYQNIYVTLYFQNQAADAANPAQPGTVVSSCYVQGIWDYAQNNLTNKFTPTELCRVVNNSFSTGIKKLKVRGRGRVFQLNLTSEVGFPTNIEGWSIAEGINQAA